MRSMLVVMAIVLMPLLVVKGQDTPVQAPIIALFENKLYAVSPQDGSAQVVAEPPAGERFRYRPFAQLSPDESKLVYITQTDPESVTGLVNSLFILDLADGTSTLLEPAGGIFDLKPANHVFTLDKPAWSADGSRLYYIRTETDISAKPVAMQLAYFDMQTQQHRLAARLDPKRCVQDLLAVKDGLVVHFFMALGADQPVTLYGADNRVISENAITGMYPYPVRDQGQDYYAIGNPNGGIASIVNVESGASQVLGDGYYPALRSQLAADQSLLVVRVVASQTEYRVFGNDQMTLMKTLEEESGVHFALAPYGQSVAYLQMDINQRAPIRILEADGTVRELPFIAEEIFWGAQEYVVFYKQA